MTHTCHSNARQLIDDAIRHALSHHLMLLTMTQNSINAKSADTLNRRRLHDAGNAERGTHPEGTKEVDGLAGEGVDNGLDLAARHAIMLEDAHADADAVLARGRPVELLHAPVTDQGCVQGGEVITRAHDGHTRDRLL